MSNKILAKVGNAERCLQEAGVNVPKIDHNNAIMVTGQQRVDGTCLCASVQPSAS